MLSCKRGNLQHDDLMSRSRRKRLPDEIFSAQIDALAQDGRGIARRDGKIVFIHGALPGEEVRFRYTALQRNHDQGQAVEVLSPSPDRVTPDCEHFGVCGGCCLQHLDSDRQLDVKQTWLLDNLTGIGKVEPAEILAPLTGPVWGYRHKARLGVRYVAKKGRVLVGFRERNGRYVADLRHCRVLHPRVGELLETLAALIQDLSIRERLATNRSGPWRYAGGLKLSGVGYAQRSGPDKTGRFRAETRHPDPSATQRA